MSFNASNVKCRLNYATEATDIFRSNVRLKASKEERQDGYYSNGKGMRSTRISWLRKIFYRFATTARELFFYKTSHGNIDIDISFVNNGRTRSSQLKNFSGLLLFKTAIKDFYKFELTKRLICRCLAHEPSCPGLLVIGNLLIVIVVSQTEAIDGISR